MNQKLSDRTWISTLADCIAGVAATEIIYMHQICTNMHQTKNVYFLIKSNQNKSGKTKATFQSHVHSSLLKEPHMCHGPPPRLLCIPGRFWVTVGVFHGCVGNVVLLQGLNEYRLKIFLNPPFS